MSFIIRAATPEDAPALVSVHNTCWRETYIGAMPSSVFDERDAAVQASIDDRRWQIERGVPWLLGFEGRSDSEELIGIALAGPPEVDHAANTQLFVLYVLQHAHGSGLGQALLKANPHFSRASSQTSPPCSGC